jgi:hypothetical protein
MTVAELFSYAYPVVLAAGLITAIGWRSRLGSAALLAIAGFTVLAVHHGLEWWWDRVVAAWFSRAARLPMEQLPDLSQLPAGLMAGGMALGIGQLVGVFLLFAAAVRGRH